MKLVQFGLAYSPNVGDGIIAECMAHGAKALRPGLTFETIDLSGRSGFGAVTVRNRALALKVLARLPRPLRHQLVLAKLGRLLDRVEPDWRAALDGADMAVIGGGQIFSDADLNFPAKIARAAGLVGAADVPLVVQSVGVSANWSPKGAEMFARVAHCDLRRVAVRDTPSAEAWRAQLSQGPTPEIARDPGLLAAACYGPGTGSDRIGLSVAAPEILAYHAEGSVAGQGKGVFFRATTEALLAEGHRVTLFCNGAEEDRAALTDLAKDPALAPALADGRLEVAPPPDTPTELAAIIRDLKAVIAHRLHALIVAYGYGLPIVGLGWDRKVESFLTSVEAEHGFLGSARVTPAEVARALATALAAGVATDTHARVLAEAKDGIEQSLVAGGL